MEEENKVEEKKRIFGFRSQKIWKKIIAVVYYFIGIIMFYFILKMKDSKSKLKKICIFYPVVLIVSGVMIFSSIPNYSYKEAIFIIEEHTGEKTIDSKELKSTEGLYLHLYAERGIFI